MENQTSRSYSKLWQSAILLIVIGVVALALLNRFKDPNTASYGLSSHASGEGATYYVDFDSGNDLNNGSSPTTAWKHSPGDSNATNIPASKVLAAGDTILFKGGVVYRGSIKFTRLNGSTTSPITLKGDGWGTEKAILDGSEPVNSSFTKCTSQSDCGGVLAWNNIYYANVGSGYTFNKGFYEDNEFLWYAQNPNPADTFDYDRISSLRVLPKGSTTITQTRTSITDPRYFTQSDPAFWNGAYVIAWRIPNVMVVKKITGYDPATNTITHEDLGGDLYTDRDSYYSVLNHVSMIDTEGEFSLDEASGRLYVWPRGGNAAAHGYSVRKQDAGVFLNSSSNFVVEGFVVQKFAFGIRSIDGGSGIVPQNVVIRNNEVRKLKSDGWYAIQVTGNNITVEGNKIIDCQRAVGILGGGTGIVVKNNFVQRTSRQGIWFMGATNSQIIGNTVRDILGTHSNAISVYSNSQNILISNNKVYTSILPLTFQQSKDLFIYNNIFVQDLSAGGGYAVGDWGSMTGQVVFANNIVKNGTVLDQSSATANVIHQNNIMSGGCGSACTRDHNIYTKLIWWQNSSNGWSLGSGEKIETDLTKIFIDPANDNYQLKTTSPALDAGTDLSALFKQDIEGITRPQGLAWDIGAYEYTDNVTPPPTPINGQCSTTLNTCTSGTFSDITDTSTNYLWSCVGMNGGTTASCSLPVPPTPVTLTISSISVTTAATSATIKWTTNVPSKASVYYGSTSNNLNLSVSESLYTTTHTITIPNLNKSARYYYQIRSANQDNTSTANSSIGNFRTKNK